MDPNKPATSPLMGWSDEKSGMVQPPPPYQESHYPGAPQPGPAYPPQPQPQGYGAPQQYGGAYNQQAYVMGQQYPAQGVPAQQYPAQGVPTQQYPAQPGIVTVQPTMYVTQVPLENPVDDYLGYSIFTMLCCCLPLGIAALIYSISAREANHSGDRLAAERNSRTARTLNHVALGLGLASLVLCIVYVVIVAVAFR